MYIYNNLDIADTILQLIHRIVSAIIWILQILFYGSAVAGYILEQLNHKNKLLYVPYYFLFMNLNVFRGVGYLYSHRKSGVWEKVRRG